MTPPRLSTFIPCGALVLVALYGCAPRQELAAPADDGSARLRTDHEELRRQVGTERQRQQVLADRLRRAEEELVRLRAQLEAQGERFEALSRRSESAAPPPTESRQAAQKQAAPEAGAAPLFDAAAAYDEGRTLFGQRLYDDALVAFRRILQQGPSSNEADNAQYWIGECYYGVGRFRRALEEFNKVLSYEKTEKDDDAQLKIARCHLSLGDTKQAIAAFHTLLETYPDSEYGTVARREMRYLEGP